MTPKFTPYTERHGPQPEFVPEHTPSFTLDRHIASLRDTDPEKWARLNREWNDPAFRDNATGRDLSLVEGAGR